MLIGVDFDNTIVCCDQLFHRAAVEKGLIPADVPVTKGKVRDFLRERGGEDAWTELQGYVYGALIHDAPTFPGVLGFFARCRQRGVALCIISHKTRYPFLGEAFDLHKAAHDWLESHSFYDPNHTGLSPSQVFFELTKQGKLDRIARAGCSHFIDDLPEFLMEPGFPRTIKRILFDPNDHHPNGDHFYRATSWMEIEQCLIGVRASD
jgi:hypothetical protein